MLKQLLPWKGTVAKIGKSSTLIQKENCGCNWLQDKYGSADPNPAEKVMIVRVDKDINYTLQLLLLSSEDQQQSLLNHC